jgi:hypothetical protein
MPLSEDELATVKAETLGDIDAQRAWSDALAALHAYAHRSDCPAGYDVIRWFTERRDAYQAQVTEAIRRRAGRPQA